MDTWNLFCKNVIPIQNKKYTITKNVRLKKINNSHYLSGHLDLHERTLDNARKEVMRYLEEMRRQNKKEVTIITGKSGSMLRELPLWLENDVNISLCELKRNGGSYKIKFKKNKK